MGSIKDISNPWRDDWVPASFDGNEFYVESGGPISGRRIVVHQKARAGATGRGTRSVLVEIRKAARKALRSGNLLVQGQIDAWNVIASANQRLADMNKSRARRMITAYHATSAAMAHGGQQPNAGAAGVLGQPLILQLDGRTIATAVVPHLQRSAKRSTATTTGRSSGTVHGI